MKLRRRALTAPGYYPATFAVTYAAVQSAMAVAPDRDGPLIVVPLIAR